MALKTIYVARHGYRSNWLPKGPYPPPPTGVDSDVPLAEHGVDQAKELAEYIGGFSAEDQPQMIFSSPFYRCIQTSEPIVKRINVPFALERGIGEWYKPDRPVIPEPAPLDKLSELFPEITIDPHWSASPTIIPSNKGETELDIFERSGKFLESFIARINRDYPTVERVLLVTHAATKQCIGMKLMGYKDVRASIDEHGTVLHNASCSIDRYDTLPQSDLWELKMNGNTDFLTNGAEMDWNFMFGFEAGSDADIKARRLRGEIN